MVYVLELHKLFVKQVQRAIVFMTAAQVWGPEKQRAAIPLSAGLRPLQKHTCNIVMYVTMCTMLMDNQSLNLLHFASSCFTCGLVKWRASTCFP